MGEIKSDKVIVYEALSNGLVKNEYSKEYLTNLYNDNRLIIGETFTNLSNVKENCEKYLGTPYGWRDIFAIGIYTLFGYKLFFNTRTKKLICSEFVSRVLYDSSNGEINFETEFGKDYDLVTPIDLFYTKYINWGKMSIILKDVIGNRGKWIGKV